VRLVLYPLCIFFLQLTRARIVASARHCRSGAVRSRSGAVRLLTRPYTLCTSVLSYSLYVALQRGTHEARALVVRHVPSVRTCPIYANSRRHRRRAYALNAEYSAYAQAIYALVLSAYYWTSTEWILTLHALVLSADSLVFSSCAFSSCVPLHCVRTHYIACVRALNASACVDVDKSAPRHMTHAPTHMLTRRRCAT